MWCIVRMVFVYVLCNICMRTAVDQSQFQLLIARQSIFTWCPICTRFMILLAVNQQWQPFCLSSCSENTKQFLFKAGSQPHTLYGRRTRCIISSLLSCFTSFLLDSTFFTSLLGRKHIRDGSLLQPHTPLFCRGGAWVPIQVLQQLLTVHAVPSPSSFLVQIEPLLASAEHIVLDGNSEMQQHQCYTTLYSVPRDLVQLCTYFLNCARFFFSTWIDSWSSSSYVGALDVGRNQGASIV